MQQILLLEDLQQAIGTPYQNLIAAPAEWSPAPTAEEFLTQNLNLMSLYARREDDGHTWFKIDPTNTFTYSS